MSKLVGAGDRYNIVHVMPFYILAPSEILMPVCLVLIMSIGGGKMCQLSKCHLSEPKFIVSTKTWPDPNDKFLI